ncbi:MAG: hypothetical protein FWD76_05705 [Firmicutes bacterium]|nr:hypothetical protein [Bacillota bacterium]
MTRVVVDFFLVGVLIVCAGVGMQVLNHKVDFYLLAGVALGFVLVVCLFFLPKISAVLPKDSQETVDASPKQET